MNFIVCEDNFHYMLTHITEKDIKFANIGGKKTDSVYESPDPNIVKRVYNVWVRDPDILNNFAELRMYIGHRTPDNEQFEVPFVSLKCYPSVKANRITGEEKLSPVVSIMGPDGNRNVINDESKFYQADIRSPERVDILFHVFPNTKYDGGKTNIARIDAITVFPGKEAPTPLDSNIDDILNSFYSKK